ncbi:MAG: hypothetical protein IJ660_03675 [Alphaproteobacteria bacterium]|nr:hypothetical protein [Alphaproteobacteria bacterium]
MEKIIFDDMIKILLLIRVVRFALLKIALTNYPLELLAVRPALQISSYHPTIKKAP